ASISVVDRRPMRLLPTSTSAASRRPSAASGGPRRVFGARARERGPGRAPRGGLTRGRGGRGAAHLSPTQATSRHARCDAADPPRTQLTPSSAHRARRERSHPKAMLTTQTSAVALDLLENNIEGKADTRTGPPKIDSPLAPPRSSKNSFKEGRARSWRSAI